VDDVRWHRRLIRFLSPRSLHSRGLLIPLLIVAAVGVVLLEGLLHRAPKAPPAAPEEVGPPPPPEVLRRPDLERAPLEYHSEYWRQLGERVRPGLALVGPRRAPAVLVSGGFALAPASAVEPPRAGEPGPSEPSSAFQLVAVDPDSGLSLFGAELPEAAPALAPAEAASTYAGELIAAVSLLPDGRLRVVPGFLASALSREDVLDVAIAFPVPVGIAAVVDLNAALLGVARDGAHGVEVLSAEAAARAAQRLLQNPRCDAIEVGALSDAVRRRLGGGGGVLVERVRDRAFASPPPIQAGDVVRRWNNQEVDSPAALQGLFDATKPGTTVRAQVLRSQRRVTVSFAMPGSCLPRRPPLVEVPQLGMSLERAGGEAGGRLTAWRVVGVEADRPASAAGFEPGDRLLAIDGVSVDGDDGPQIAERLRAARGSGLVAVRRGHRLQYLAIAAANRGRDGR
jgi:hypothetical protein